MKRFYLILFPILILAGCIGGHRRADEGESDKNSAASFAYNPLEMAEDTVIIPVKYPINVNSSYRESPRKGEPSDSAAISKSKADRYRIQIFTSRVYGQALKESNTASQVFDQKVWMDYEVPYYKVRIGDFSSQSKAEEYLPVVRNAGYGSAWIVRVSTNIQTLDTNPRGEPNSPEDSSNIPSSVMEPAHDKSSYPGH
ncbi:MAG: SPOR domain-containing protein [candidate division Zixibacteria bacterium]|nr:SPOR domain-containing protein [candidate division Zixibacteria bacterium]